MKPTVRLALRREHLAELSSGDLRRAAAGLPYTKLAECVTEAYVCTGGTCTHCPSLLGICLDPA